MVLKEGMYFSDEAGVAGQPPAALAGGDQFAALAFLVDVSSVSGVGCHPTPAQGLLCPEDLGEGGLLEFVELI